MKTLTLSTGNFDQQNTFTFKGFEMPVTCSLHKDYEKAGDGIYWAMQHSACVKANYTEADKAERDRLNSGNYTISNGEIVLIDGKKYKVRFLGDYSDCAVFDLV